VDFGLQTLNTSFALNFAAGSATFSNNSIGFSGASVFNGFLSSSTGSLCSGSGCSAEVRGFFAGTGASRAGMAYKVFTSNFDNITGTAAFTKSGL
jgi:hypothetical protein